MTIIAMNAAATHMISGIAAYAAACWTWTECVVPSLGAQEPQGAIPWCSSQNTRSAVPRPLQSRSVSALAAVLHQPSGPYCPYKKPESGHGADLVPGGVHGSGTAKQNLVRH